MEKHLSGSLQRLKVTIYLFLSTTAKVFPHTLPNITHYIYNTSLRKQQACTQKNIQLQVYDSTLIQGGTYCGLSVKVI